MAPGERKDGRSVTSEEAALGVAPHSAPQPVTFVELHNDRLDKCPLRAHSVRTPPSAVSGSPAPCGWSGRPSASWSPLFGGRQSAALPDWSFCAAQFLEKAATWGPHVVFLPAGTCSTRWQNGGDCNAIAGVQAAGTVFRASAHLSRVLVGARGHTCRTLPRAGSVSASRSR